MSDTTSPNGDPDNSIPEITVNWESYIGVIDTLAASLFRLGMLTAYAAILSMDDTNQNLNSSEAKNPPKTEKS